MIQSVKDLEKWHKKPDPWNYTKNPHDAKRKAILLNELPERTYKKTLDIGCGQGFITEDLPGKSIVGVDISENAIKHARLFARKRKLKHLSYAVGSIFTLAQQFHTQFDLIIITGTMYPQYIGNSKTLVYIVLDSILKKGGILASVHINDWYSARFPYLLLKETFYDYREYVHRLEIYVKP